MNTRMTGRIERRLLVNYRVDPAAAMRILPAGMRPVIAGASVRLVTALLQGRRGPGSTSCTPARTIFRSW